MKRFKVLVLFFCSLTPLSTPVFAKPPAPPQIPGVLEPGLVLRAFADHGPFSLLGDGQAISESDDRQLREITAGGYYQPLSELKLGVFYRRAYGVRHNEDWRLDTTTGQWSWADTNSRGEDFLILDASPRIGFGNWVGELKFRYLYDTFDHEETLLARPGITYFLLRDDKPFWNFFLQFELDFPLNYGEQTTDQTWLYLGALYQLTDAVAVGAFTAAVWETWSYPPAYAQKGGAPYELTTASAVLAVTSIFHFDF